MLAPFIMIGICVLVIIAARLTQQQFTKTHGLYSYIALGPFRRECGGWGVGLYVAVSLMAQPELNDLSLLVWWFWTVGVYHFCVMVGLNLKAREITETTALHMVRQGYFNPPVAAPPTAFAPLMIEHEPVPQFRNVPVTPAPQDEGAFTFDPEKFKR